ISASACRLEEDIVVLYEHGLPVKDPTSFIIESEKGITYTGGWEICPNAKCRKRRDMPSNSGKANDIVICRLQHNRSAFRYEEWKNAYRVTDSPKGYQDYVAGISKTCERKVFSLPQA